MILKHTLSAECEEVFGQLLQDFVMLVYIYFISCATLSQCWDEIVLVLKFFKRLNSYSTIILYIYYINIRILRQSS